MDFPSSLLTLRPFRHLEMWSETGHPIMTGLFPVPDCCGSNMDGNGAGMTGAPEPDPAVRMNILNPIGNSNDSRSKCLSYCSRGFPQGRLLSFTFLMQEILRKCQKDITFTSAASAHLEVGKCLVCNFPITARHSA